MIRRTAMVISVSDCEKGSSILPQKTNLNDENRTGESKSGIRERSTISNGKSLPTSMRECSTLLRHTKAEIKEIVLLRFQRKEQERQQMIESLMFSGTRRDKEHATKLRNLQKI